MRADFVLDYDVLTVEQAHKLYVMARLTSGPAPDDQRRRPLNLSLVIDRSGSMAGDKISYTRQASQFLVQNLGTRDILSIVLYNEAIETLLAPEPVTHKDTINHRIAGVKATGTTNLSGGWLEGCNLVAKNLDSRRLNRVILMSDGLANRGVTDSEKLVALAQQKLEEGISTTTMGLGSDFNEDLLMAIADAGGGAFYFIESPEVAPTIFQEELQGLLSVVGQNLMITVQPTEHVTDVNQLNVYPMQRNGNEVAFRLGDVFGEEVKTLLLELTIPALHELGQCQIAVLQFEYDELSANGAEHRTLELPIIVNIAPQGIQPILANPEVRQSVLLLKTAQARREAVKAADQGDYKKAAAILRAAAEAIAEGPMDDEQLIEEHRALLQQATDLEHGAESYDKYSRKTMQTQAFYTSSGRHGESVVLRQREVERVMNLSKTETEQTPAEQRVAPKFLSWNRHDYPLDRDLIRIGRAPQNEIVIDAPGISRFHCQIKREGDKLLIEDLGSTNGTIIEGQMIDVPYVLGVGTVVYLSNEKLVFRADAKPTRPAGGF